MSNCAECNGAQCEWDKETKEWVCHRYDDLLNCHSLKKEEGVGWYCSLKKGHEGDHKCFMMGKLLRRWKQ